MISGGVGSSGLAVKFLKRLTGCGPPVYGLWDLRLFATGRAAGTLITDEPLFGPGAPTPHTITRRIARPARMRNSAALSPTQPDRPSSAAVSPRCGSLVVGRCAARSGFRRGRNRRMRNPASAGPSHRRLRPRRVPDCLWSADAERTTPHPTLTRPPRRPQPVPWISWRSGPPEALFSLKADHRPSPPLASAACRLPAPCGCPAAVCRACPPPAAALPPSRTPVSQAGGYAVGPSRRRRVASASVRGVGICTPGGAWRASRSA